jgi:hypothetical protein
VTYQLWRAGVKDPASFFVSCVSIARAATAILLREQPTRECASKKERPNERTGKRAPRVEVPGPECGSLVVGNSNPVNILWKPVVVNKENVWDLKSWRNALPLLQCPCLKCPCHGSLRDFGLCWDLRLVTELWYVEGFWFLLKIVFLHGEILEFS